MGKTSAEVRQRWESNNYNKYMVRLRKDTDKDLIEYLETQKQSRGTTEIFREALETYLKKEGI